ncbi:sensor histidine kinase [Nocardiopsis aegyptia]|uniref:histidine kinase n=1 Tax=Nocardiopsis aegyptia TaxID=220378 RepID=A0A7Z0EVI7_9ACTN|nr:sensor histidine kinase [Nocardiopsis aegyptia]NYJ38083.1 signal transduction histidine kinase [Nocardiopsis aegyptia]
MWEPWSSGRIRTLVADAVLGVLMGLVALVAARGQLAWRGRPGPGGHWGGPGWGEGPGSEAVWESVVLPWGVWAGVGLLVVAVAVRRVWPRVGVVAAAAGTGVFLAWGAGPGPVLVLAALVVFSAGIRMAPGRFVVWVGPAVVAAGLVSQAGRPWWGLLDGGAASAVVFAVGSMAVPAGAGVFVRARRESRARAEAEEVERHRFEERLRIAREVHDLVGHSLSVISMQAGVALHVVDRRPEQASVALEAIRESSRAALEELRGTLAVFRGEGVERAPLAGLGRVESLVGELRSAGRSVEVVWEGEPVEVPGAVDHAALRIVQEALTNVVRHAGDVPARVSVVFAKGELVVRVRDEGRGAGVVREGAGIAGMRERARAVGGQVDVGAVRGGGFEVVAVLPLAGER